MPIQIEYAKGPGGNALVDLASAFDEAVAAKDGPADATLRALLYDYFEETLASMSPAALAAYLEDRKIWRTDGAHTVFKTAGEPCAAYAALDRDGSVAVLVLGFCYAYPVSEQAWWTDVIQPRLSDYT